MSWYYNAVTGSVFQASGVEATALNAEIFAEKHDPIPGQTIWGPYAAEAGAQAAKGAHKPSAGSPAAVSTITSAIPSTTTIVSAIEGWAVRGSEIVVGVALLAVAAHAIITSGSAGSSAATLAKTAGTVVKLVK
jgi:hypothetical protein